MIGQEYSHCSGTVIHQNVNIARVEFPMLTHSSEGHNIIDAVTGM
jgi:hypothetical protein